MKIYKENIAVIILIALSYFIFHQAQAGLVSSFSDQLSRQTISTAANHSFSFIPASDFGPGQTLELYFETDFDLSEIDYTDIDLLADGNNKNLGALPGNGVASNIGVVVAGQTITFTQNDTDTLLASSVVNILIGTNATHQKVGNHQIYNPTVAGQYQINLFGTFGDLGSLSIQILNTDAVSLNASITPTLSFYLRNNADTGNFSGCTFSNLTFNIVSECSFRVAAETNIGSGFQLYLRSDGDLRNDSGIISPVQEGQTISAGTEAYGLALQAGASIFEANDFNDDDTPISSTDSLLVYSNSVYNYIAGNLATSSLITLKLAISPLTKSGLYYQTIIFSLLPNY